MLTLALKFSKKNLWAFFFTLSFVSCLKFIKAPILGQENLQLGNVVGTWFYTFHLYLFPIFLPTKYICVKFYAIFDKLFTCKSNNYSLCLLALHLPFALIESLYKSIMVPNFISTNCKFLRNNSFDFTPAKSIIQFSNYQFTRSYYWPTLCCSHSQSFEPYELRFLPSQKKQSLISKEKKIVEKRGSFLFISQEPHPLVARGILLTLLKALRFFMHKR